MIRQSFACLDFAADEAFHNTYSLWETVVQLIGWTPHPSGYIRTKIKATRDAKIATEASKIRHEQTRTWGLRACSRDRSFDESSFAAYSYYL